TTVTAGLPARPRERRTQKGPACVPGRSARPSSPKAGSDHVPSVLRQIAIGALGLRMAACATSAPTEAALSGHASPESMTDTAASPCTATCQTAIRRDGAGQIRHAPSPSRGSGSAFPAYDRDESRELRVVGLMPPDKVIVEHRVRQIQK